jgi:hypothetical protein
VDIRFADNVAEAFGTDPDIFLARLHRYTRGLLRHGDPYSLDALREALR